MAEKRCEACGGDTAGLAYICEKCQEILNREIRSIPNLLRELEVEITRRSRKTTVQTDYRQPFSTAERPLPYHGPAAEVSRDLQTWLRGVQLRLQVYNGHSRQGTVPFTRQVAVVASKAATLALQPDAATLLHRLRRLTRRATQIIDTPDEVVGIGRCSCGADMLARRAPEDADGGRQERHHTCRECGAGYLVEDSLRRRQMASERALEDFWVTGAQVEAATLGRIRRDRIQKWVQRGRIYRTQDGRVRFGDALDLDDEYRSRAA